MTRPPAQQWQTCCTVASSPWSSRASGMKYLFISCSVTSAPFMAAPCFRAHANDKCYNVIRVMSCVWCCRAEHVLTMILLWSTFRKDKPMIRVLKQDPSASCWCRSCVVFPSPEHHQPPRHVQEEYYLHSDSFVIYNFAILFWWSLVSFAVLRDNDAATSV